MFCLKLVPFRNRFFSWGKITLLIVCCWLIFQQTAVSAPDTGREKQKQVNKSRLLVHPNAPIAGRIPAKQSVIDTLQASLEEKRTTAIQQQNWREAAGLSVTLSQYCYGKFRYDDCIRYGNEGINQARKAKSPALEAALFYELGVAYFGKFDYAQAVDYCLKALQLSPHITDPGLIIRLNNRMGMIYKRVEDYPNAKAYLETAYKEAIRSGTGPLYDILMNLGNVEEYLGHYQNSLSLYQQYLNLHPNDPYTQVLAYNNTGNVYLKLQQPAEALSLFQKAYALEDTVKNPRGRAYSYYSFALAAHALNNTTAAIRYALQSITLTKKYRIKSLEWLCYEVLANGYEKSGDHQQANTYLRKFIAARDSVHARQRLDRIGVLEASYQFELQTGKKQKEILSLQKENALKQLALSNLQNENTITQLQLTNLVSEKQLAQLQVSNLQQADSLNQLKLENYNKAIVVNGMTVKNLRQQNEVKSLALSLQRRNQLLLALGMLVLAGGFIYVYRYQRLKKERELEKIRATIAADFHDELGSTLSSIALSSEMVLYSQGEATPQLQSVLSQISESARNTVSAMKDMIWTIEPANDNLEEMVFRMKTYAFPFAEVTNIALNLQIEETIRSVHLSMEKRKNLYLIFKEALNNAFKYSGAKTILVSLTCKKEQLTLEIKDDGRGFDLSTAKRGNGLRNMQKRAAQSDGTLFVQSAPEKGTAVFFTCPLADKLKKPHMYAMTGLK
ncbi:hypothetical protein GCM10028805_06810 [Spirosoma harenae]